MNWSKLENFSANLIETALEKIGNFIFSLWGMIWVWIDEIKKALNSISGLDFAKIVTKAMLYSLCVVAWIILFFGITLIGWAII